MIEPADIIDLPGTPAVIREAGDVPWHYLGEVEPGHPYCRAVCQTCMGEAPSRVPDPAPPTVDLHEVPLQPYEFIQDDGRRVRFFWGRCPKCGHVTYGLEPLP